MSARQSPDSCGFWVGDRAISGQLRQWRGQGYATTCLRGLKRHPEIAGSSSCGRRSRRRARSFGHGGSARTAWEIVSNRYAAGCGRLPGKIRRLSAAHNPTSALADFHEPLVSCRMLRVRTRSPRVVQFAAHRNARVQRRIQFVRREEGLWDNPTRGDNAAGLSVNARYRRTCSGRLTTVTFSTLTRSRPWLPLKAGPRKLRAMLENTSLCLQRRLPMTIPLREFRE